MQAKLPVLGTSAPTPEEEIKKKKNKKKATIPGFRKGDQGSLAWGWIWGTGGVMVIDLEKEGIPNLSETSRQNDKTGVKWLELHRTSKHLNKYPELGTMTSRLDTAVNQPFC